MPVQLFTSRQFHQEPGTLKRAAIDGPVFITDRGTPQFVLMTKSAYDQLSNDKPKRTLGEAMRMVEAADIDFEPVRTNLVMRDVDLD